MDVALPHHWPYHGRDPYPRRRQLRAGPISAAFDPQDCGLHHIRAGGVEVVRAIYVALRDTRWDTVPPRLVDWRLQESSDAFNLVFDVACRRRDIDFMWRGTVSGQAAGTMTYTMQGHARSSFARTRIGICLLYPAGCAGARVRTEDMQGDIVDARFPVEISPHQPFSDLRGFAHEAAEGIWADVRFDGDTFEMEDQRNWSDFSFKIYSTPLSLPFPVEIPAGTRIDQSVALTLRSGVGDGAPHQRSEPLPTASAVTSPSVHVRSDAHAHGTLPSLGLQMSGQDQPLRAEDVDLLRSLHLGHLRVDLQLSAPGWQGALQAATVQSGQLGTEIEAAVYLSDQGDEELRFLREHLERLNPPVRTWLIFHQSERATAERWVRLARSRLSDYRPTARFATGTDGSFVEVNRRPPGLRHADLITFAVTPQMHQFDDESVVETLAGQALVAHGARRLAGGRGVVVSPVTLHRRSPWPRMEACGGIESDDPRQATLFAAAWTVGSIAELAGAGVDSVTYCATTGRRGLVPTEPGPPTPGAGPGRVFPAYHVFAAVGDLVGAEILPVVVSHADHLATLCLRQQRRVRLLLANLGDSPKCINVKGCARAEARYLDETTAALATYEPERYREMAPAELGAFGGAVRVPLLPWAVASLDIPA